MLIQRWLKHFAALDAEPSAPAPVAWSVDVLRNAIRTRREVVAFLGKEWLVFYAHDLRHTDRDPEVLAYLVYGHPYGETGKADPLRRWVWLPVEELWGVEARGLAPEASTPLPGPLRRGRDRDR